MKYLLLISFVVLSLIGCQLDECSYKVKSIKRGVVFVTSMSSMYKIGDTLDLGGMGINGEDKCIIIDKKQ